MVWIHWLVTPDYGTYTDLVVTGLTIMACTDISIQQRVKPVRLTVADDGTFRCLPMGGQTVMVCHRGSE